MIRACISTCMLNTAPSCAPENLVRTPRDGRRMSVDGVVKRDMGAGTHSGERASALTTDDEPGIVPMPIRWHFREGEPVDRRARHPNAHKPARRESVSFPTPFRPVLLPVSTPPFLSE